MSDTGQETEAKFYIGASKRMETQLQDLGARLLRPRVLETNIRFDLPDARLRSERRVLRLRRDTDARLTYKSAGTNNQGVLSRTEIEFIVQDFEKARQFLEALGYEPIFYYEKYRTTYDLEGILIMLDELPYGDFIEIEGETVESIRGVSDKLKLNWDAAIAASYHALFERLCAKRPDVDPTNLSFAALKELKITPEELSVRAADA